MTFLFPLFCLFTDVSINGKLSDKGFEKVSIQYKTAKLLVSLAESIYSDKENTLKFVWGQSEPSKLESDR